MTVPKTATILRMFKTWELWYFNLLHEYSVEVCLKKQTFWANGYFQCL